LQGVVVVHHSLPLGFDRLEGAAVVGGAAAVGVVVVFALATYIEYKLVQTFSQN